MEYLIGVGLALAVAVMSVRVGFDRDRSFTATVMIVIAFYYVLFAVVGGSGRSIVIETLVAMGFVVLALYGFYKNLLVVAGAIAGHGLFDFVHHLLIDNPGLPAWWPGFCGAFDVVFGGYAAWVVSRRRSARD